MNEPSRAPLVAALAYWAGAVVLALLLRPLLPVDETRYLSVAWEMWRGGDYLVPHLNGEPYSDKPPLLFWLINAAWYVFGVNAPVARLTAMTFVPISMALSYWIARLLWPEDRRAALWAPTLLGGMTAFTTFGSLTMFDVPLTACVLLALIGALLVACRGWQAGWLLFALGLALGVLFKGPVVLVHVVAAPLLLPIWLKGRPPGGLLAWYGGLILAIVIGAALALAWAIPASRAGGEAYGDMILWGQSAGRMSHSFAHRKPFYFFLVLLPVLLFPWFFWPRFWRSLGTSGRGSDRGLRFTALWFVVTLVFFSAISGKQIHYLLPELPAFALFSARLLGRLEQGRVRPGRFWPALVLSLIGLIILAFGLLDAMGGAPARWRLPDWSGAIGPWLGGGLAVAGLALFFLAGRGQTRHLVAGIALSAVLFAAVHAGGAAGPFERYDLAPVAALLAPRAASGIATTTDYEGEFNFLARLEQPIERIKRGREKDWFEAHPDGVIIAGYREESERLTGKLLFEQFYRGALLGLYGKP